jgi:STE24 endopeptidase
LGTLGGFLSLLGIGLVLSGLPVFPFGAYCRTMPPAVTQMTQEKKTPSSDKVDSYRLPPEIEQKAHRKYVSATFLCFFSLLYQFAVLVFILDRKWVQKMRDRAEELHVSRWGQSWSVIPRFWLAYCLLLLPSNVFAQYVGSRFLPGTPGWQSWFFSWGSDFVYGLIAFPILACVVYSVIDKSPRRWWLYFGLCCVFIYVLVVSGAVFDTGNGLSALRLKHPELVVQVQKLASRDQVQIPKLYLRERSAMEPASPPNAYAVGFGSRRRIVIWADAIAKLNADQMSFVAAHEIGHYRLNHFFKMMSFSSVLFMLLTFGLYQLSLWLRRRWGEAWGIPDLRDWTSLPLLLLAFSVARPVEIVLHNLYGWNQEVQADQYGLELIHGVIPAPNQAAAQALQILGEESLEYDHGNIFSDIFLSDHPSTNYRIKSILNYDPWQKGRPPMFVKERK